MNGLALFAVFKFSLLFIDFTGTLPTIGFNRFVMEKDGIHIGFYDLGGGKTFRGIWEKYYAEVCNIHLV